MSIRKDHPLMQGDLTHLEDWQAWRAAWDANPSIEVRHGLLHTGLDVPNTRRERDYRTGELIPLKYSEDKLAFYLAVADGWTEEDHFKSPDHRSYGDQYDGNRRKRFCNLSQARKRQRLAAKAFAMIFSNWLTPSDEKTSFITGYESQRPLWCTFTSTQVMTVLRFFRPWQRHHYGYSLERDSGITNLRYTGGRTKWPTEVAEVRGHLLDKVKLFLTQFLYFLWKDYKPREYHHNGRERPDAGDKRAAEEAEAANQREAKFADSLPRHRTLFAYLLIELHGEEALKHFKALPMDERTIEALRSFALRGRVEAVHYDSKQDKLVGKKRQVRSLQEVIARCRDRPRVIVAKFLLLHDAHERGVKEKEELDKPAHDQAKAARRRKAEARRRKQAAELRAEAEKLERGE